LNSPSNVATDLRRVSLLKQMPAKTTATDEQVLSSEVTEPSGSDEEATASTDGET